MSFHWLGLIGHVYVLRERVQSPHFNLHSFLRGGGGVTYIYADTIHAIQIQQFRHIHLILNVKFINIFLASGMIEYGKIPEKSLLQLLVTFYSAS